MTAYTQTTDSQQMADAVRSGRVKQIDGQWYLTEWHVAYAQGGMDTSDNFVTREEAESHFAKRLADVRAGWGNGGNRFSETPVERPNGGKAILFRSIRKNGKPGTLTGILYMAPITR